TVHKAGPWTQGPVFLQILALLKEFDLSSLDPDGAEFNHILVEAAKLALADRDAWYGDPNFVDIPIQTLLSDGYNSIRRSLIGENASHELRPGQPDGRSPRLPNRSTIEKGGEAEPPRKAPLGTQKRLLTPSEGDTCHFDIIDRHGNVVSATPSGGWLQH